MGAGGRLTARPLPQHPAIGLAAGGVIGLLVLVNIALISLKIGGVPIRALMATGILGVMVLLLPDLFVQVVKRHTAILLLALALALLGVFVSLVNGVSPAVIGQMLLEVHVQAMVTLLLATMLAELAGPRRAVAWFCAAVGVTAFVSLIQFLGIEAGWSLREALGNMQDHLLLEDSSFINRRPMGLSYSPIHLATQACLAFAAYAALRLWSRKGTAQEKQIDWAILAALALLVAVAFFGQNRSPILGAALFVALYLLWRGSAFYSLVIIAGGAAAAFAAPMILDMMQDASTRVLRIGDNSSSGRLTLATYGFLLMADNPLGYGFGFVSQEHWAPFWQELYTMPSAKEVREAELHNYALNMLTTYGIGLLLVAPLIAQAIWAGRTWLIAFVPYIVHLAFHNTGPFWNDTLFWFVVGAISVMSCREAAAPMLRPVRPRPRPRAPARPRVRAA